MGPYNAVCDLQDKRAIRNPPQEATVHRVLSKGGKCGKNNNIALCRTSEGREGKALSAVHQDRLGGTTETTRQGETPATPSGGNRGSTIRQTTAGDSARGLYKTDTFDF